MESETGFGKEFPHRMPFLECSWAKALTMERRLPRKKEVFDRVKEAKKAGQSRIF